MNNTEMLPSNNQEKGPERNKFDEAARVFGYLDDHPGVGFILAGACTAGGLSALAYYGGKLLSA